MARPALLEYTAGSSRKFWQVIPSGRNLTVKYGRIGTGGQAKTKTFPTPEAAAAEAARLTAAKLKAGYVPFGSGAAAASSEPAKTRVAKASPPNRPGPKPITIIKHRSGDLVGLWHEGKDVWWAQVFADEPGAEVLKAGGTLAEAVAGEGGAIERWRFASEAEAKKAAAWAARNFKGPKAELRNDTAADLAAWTRRAQKETRDCTPRLEIGAGPITLTRDTAHPYIYPRPPATSYLSKRTMVPVFSLVGPIDDRLGKRTGIFVNVCPQAMLSPHIEHVWEVPVQDPAKKSTVDAYFEASSGAFASVHLSMQVETLDGDIVWAVIEHDGNKGTVGFYRTTHFKKRDLAEKAFHELVASKTGGLKRVDRPGAHYLKILDEIVKHNRVPRQKPAKNIKLRVAHAAMIQSVHGSSYSIGDSSLGYKLVRLGGVPHFCQEDWDFSPVLFGDKPLYCVASVGRGDGPQWSDVLNDGDAGTINVYAAPGLPFGTVSFSCC